MDKAYITDVHYRMGLSVVRALGKKSIDITTLEYEKVPVKSILGFYSRYARSKALLPNPMNGEDGFIEKIKLLAKRDMESSSHTAKTKPVLIPVGLDTLLTVARNSKSLEPYVDFAVTSPENLDIANDKGKLLEIAAKAGIPCPMTTTLRENESVRELSGRLDYPVVIKYRCGELLNLGPSGRYNIVHDRKSFVDIFNLMHRKQEFPLVQEYVTGTGFGVSAVFNKAGVPLEVFCHRRLREYPVSGGPSSFCESIWDDRLAGYAIKLLKALNWCGVAMVEFKGDLDGRVCLMEINPRFWGSLPLSIHAGCNIPYAVYRAAKGEDEKTCESPPESLGYYKNRYKQGIQMRFLFQDLLSFPGYLKLNKNKSAFILKYLGQLFDPRIRDGVLARDDIRPSLAYVRQAFKKFTL